MLNANPLVLSTVARVRSGNMVAIDVGGRRYFALRVSLNAQGEPPLLAAVMVFGLTDRGHNGLPFVIPRNIENTECLDLGQAVVKVPKHAMASSTGDIFAAGILTISPAGPAISATYWGSTSAGGRWSPLDGQPVANYNRPERFTHWSIGVQQCDREPFVPLATYPLQTNDA